MILFLKIYGTVVILDFEGMSMKQVMEITPTFCMRLVNFIQDAMPLRLKEVRVRFSKIILILSWVFVKIKLNDRLKNRNSFEFDDGFVYSLL